MPTAILQCPLLPLCRASMARICSCEVLLTRAMLVKKSSTNGGKEAPQQCLRH